MEQIVEDFKQSGKSQRVWCEEQGINRSTLRYWLERLDELAEGTEISFTELVTGGDEIC
ncbi:MAG: helix-turn-helix domain-containing protein [Ruminococcus sp.]|nr:helix-turn-helix domain-containing protein [Ruminococcus sp.]